MVQEFQNPVVGRRYRQGTMKCFFNYLLIDPRIADVSFISWRLSHTFNARISYNSV